MAAHPAWHAQLSALTLPHVQVAAAYAVHGPKTILVLARPVSGAAAAHACTLRSPRLLLTAAPALFWE